MLSINYLFHRRGNVGSSCFLIPGIESPLRLQVTMDPWDHFSLIARNSVSHTLSPTCSCGIGFALLSCVSFTLFWCVSFASFALMSMSLAGWCCDRVQLRILRLTMTSAGLNPVALWGVFLCSRSAITHLCHWPSLLHYRFWTFHGGFCLATGSEVAWQRCFLFETPSRGEFGKFTGAEHNNN